MVADAMPVRARAAVARGGGIRNRAGNRAALLLSLVCCGLVVGQVLCSHIVSFRYLHPFTVLVVLNAAAVVDGMLALAARRRVQIERTMSPREAMAT